MTESEILTSYRQAADKSKQLGILAELNLTTRREIREVLARQGAQLPKPRREPSRRRLDQSLAMDLYCQGMSCQEISGAMGAPYTIVTTLENEYIFSSVVDKRVVVFSFGKHTAGLRALCKPVS